VEGSSPSKTKEETSKAQLLERKMMLVHVDQLTPYHGTVIVRTKSQGRKARPIIDVTSTSLRKEKMVVHL
jgi:hypothetical protein